MGNVNEIAKELSGEIVVGCGCSKAIGFEKSAATIIRVTGLQPWPARQFIKDRLEFQNDLARRSVLQYISVHDAFAHFQNGMDRRGCLSERSFLAIVRNLIETHQHVITRECKTTTNAGTGNGQKSQLIDKSASVDKELRIIDKGQLASADTLQANLSAPCGSACSMTEDLLPHIFSILDYDGNGELSLGEISVCLVDFFFGTKVEKAAMESELLDRDRDDRLSREDLQALLSPLVWAMSPAQAAILRPLLLQKGTERIFGQVGVENHGTVSCSEFQKWRIAHSVIDELLVVVEGEMYQIWLNRPARPVVGSLAETAGAVDVPVAAATAKTRAVHIAAEAAGAVDVPVAAAQAKTREVHMVASTPSLHRLPSGPPAPAPPFSPRSPPSPCSSTSNRDNAFPSPYLAIPSVSSSSSQAGKLPFLPLLTPPAPMAIVPFPFQFSRV